MVNRITWHSSSMGGTNGFVGQLSLFHIGYGINQPEDGFVLSGELPMPTLKGFATEDAAKERAERRLRNFVTHLGASFPPEASEAEEKAPVTAKGLPPWSTELETDLRHAYVTAPPSDDIPSRHLGLLAVYNLLVDRMGD